MGIFWHKGNGILSDKDEKPAHGHGILRTKVVHSLDHLEPLISSHDWVINCFYFSNNKPQLDNQVNLFRTNKLINITE